MQSGDIKHAIKSMEGAQLDDGIGDTRESSRSSAIPPFAATKIHLLSEE
jgi:hypothetical protein